MVGAGSDMGVSIGGKFSAGQSPLEHRASSGVGWLSPLSLGAVGTLVAEPQARLSLVSRTASAFQRSLLEGDHEADGVSASPSPGLCARGPGSKELSRDGTRTTQAGSDSPWVDVLDSAPFPSYF